MLRATTTYTPDDRTNQIIVIADPREYPLFDSIISQLDIKSDPFTRMEVIPLKHGDAKDVATLLSNADQRPDDRGPEGPSQSVRPGPGRDAPQPATPAAAPAAAATALTQEGPGERVQRLHHDPARRAHELHRGLGHL
jgi:general secretion pathway protein D